MFARELLENVPHEIINISDTDSFSFSYVKISYDENLRQKRFTLQNYRKRRSTLIWLIFGFKVKS